VIPLVSLVASFAIVLVLGAAFATGETGAGSPPPSSPPPPSGKGGEAVVHITIDRLSADNGVWVPFPGVRLTITPAAGAGVPSGGHPPESTEVDICAARLPEGWKVSASEGWTRRNGQSPPCHRFPRISGQVGPVDIQLERI